MGVYTDRHHAEHKWLDLVLTVTAPLLANRTATHSSAR